MRYHRVTRAIRLRRPCYASTPDVSHSPPNAAEADAANKQHARNPRRHAHALLTEEAADEMLALLGQSQPEQRGVARCARRSRLERLRGRGYEVWVDCQRESSAGQGDGSGKDEAWWGAVE